jgi:hypothetical protein
MPKPFIVGLLSGFGLALLFFRGNLSDPHARGLRFQGSSRMTAEEKIIADAREVIEQKPEAKTPNADFIRDWAYGNAGLEDERITLEQVETVLSKRSA